MGSDLLNGIPRVDIERPATSQRIIGRLLSFAPITAFHRTVSAPIDKRLMRLTGGRFSTAMGSAPVLNLRTIGAKSGAPRDVTLAYFTDGDDVILIASNYGQIKYPSWYHNLVENPECELSSKSGRGRFVARETTGADHDRLYALAEGTYGNFRMYKANTTGVRPIPVLRLSPVT